jgi:hypothetical protein
MYLPMPHVRTLLFNLKCVNAHLGTVDLRHANPTAPIADGNAATLARGRGTFRLG